MVVLVAGIGILVNIYNSMNERRREIAVMRALGARRSTVFQIILLESIMLSLFGGLAGWLFGHALTWLIGQVWLIEAAGVSLNFWELVSVNVGSEPAIRLPLELLLIGGLVGLASVVGYLPAMTAYRTDVSKCLASSP
jgi:putative ABC transport system permease protein